MTAWPFTDDEPADLQCCTTRRAANRCMAGVGGPVPCNSLQQHSCHDSDIHVAMKWIASHHSDVTGHPVPEDWTLHPRVIRARGGLSNTEQNGGCGGNPNSSARMSAQHHPDPRKSCYDAVKVALNRVALRLANTASSPHPAHT